MSEERVLVEISAHHVHVTQEDLETLFGKGYQLTVKKMLSQPGMFASNERVTIKGVKHDIGNVSILGPCRKASQVEVSLTDARTLGITTPIRESGDLDGTPGVTLVGPNGEVALKQGLIVAKRHIHLTPADAKKYNVTNGEIVKIQLDTADRATVFDDVVIRVSDSFAPACHLDTDEANAAAVPGSTMGLIIKK